MYRVGIDTGGTFTDLVGLDEESGRIVIAKRPSTPHDPALAVFDALERAVPPEQVGYFVLGTTIAVNSLLQRKGARVIYITTAGFEDVPHIQRINRKYLYDLQWEKAKAFVDRQNCLGVRERVLADGTVAEPLADEELEALAERVARRLPRDGRDAAIAINLLFSFANPAHEQRLAAFLRQRFPYLPISVSHEVAPIWREYERASTVIADAAIKPIVSRFAGRLAEGARERGVRSPLFLMKSNGGQVAAEAAAEAPVQLMLSGLAGGIIAGRYYGGLVGSDNLITLDMGGTSADVGLVVRGAINYSTSYELEFGIPVAAPFIDLTTIGAGGSSIATLDKGGFLKVGPESAAADPGPAAYGLGGTEATVTDANLVLGRLNPDYFLGGEMKLDPALARAAVERLAARLGRGLEETAQAVIELANENMANAMRLVTVDRGLDYREFDLVAFGGAGPLHATEMAAALGIPRVIVPTHPGLTSAFGTLLADLRVDKRWTHAYRSDTVTAEQVEAAFASLAASALADLRREGFVGEPVVERTVSMRYAGQNYEQEVAVPPGPIDGAALARLLQAFHEQHERFYGYAIPENVIELVHFNVTLLGHTRKPELPLLPEGPLPEPVARRRVYFKQGGWTETPIYRRDHLRAGNVIDGPAVIEEIDSTTLVHPGQRASVSPHGVLVIVQTAGAPAQHSALSTQHSALAPDGAIDTVTLRIINNHLVNTCQEMARAMMRTAYSPIFNEGLDFSTIIYDRDGEMLAMADMNPAMLGAALLSGKWIIQELGKEGFEPGDVVIHNDPYRGGSHMPEHLLLMPFFYKGELFGFVGNVGHVAEIGGMAPGSFASNATDVYQEGLRLPPVKIMRRGQHNEDLWKVILANHRTPDNSWGDFNAMIGSLRIGERRLTALLDKYGPDFIRRAAVQLMDHAEQWMRQEIRALPDGEYYFEDCMEDDGVSTTPVWLRARVIVKGDELIVDFTGTDPQCRGPVNSPYVVCASAAYNGILQLMSHDIPLNAGTYRPITIIDPPGCALNVRHPGACVGGQTEVQPRVIDMMQGGALSQAVPEKIAAACGGTSGNFLFGGVHPRTGRYYTHYHFDGIGWGGRYRTDGNSAQIVPHGNCQNTPIEVFETRFPWIHECYRLRQDSGAGRTRGGVGTTRIMRVAAPEITVSALFDRTRVRPWGIYGGEDGLNASCLVRRKGDDRFRPMTEAFGTVSASKFMNIVLREGDAVAINSACGGGYGPPYERDAALVLQDVREGWVTPPYARGHYGVALVPEGDDWRIDEEETARLRAAMRAANPPPRVAHPNRPAPPPAPPVGAPARADGPGRWEERRPRGFQTNVENCELCGQMIAGRAWVVPIRGRDHEFCSPRCERMYLEYWLPRYG